MIETVIFDMDGVIVDSEPIHYKAYMKHFGELGIEVDRQLYSTFTGNSTRNIYQKLKQRFDLPDVVDDLVLVKRNIFNELFDSADLFLLDGVEELIRDLHSNDMQLILASSSAKVTIDRIFRRFGLHQYFSHIVSGEDFPRSKPDPAIFLKAVELSGSDKQQCIVIEDSTNGIMGAKAAGIYCIGYKSLNSKLQDLSMADQIVSHFNELNSEKIGNINV